MSIQRQSTVESLSEWSLGRAFWVCRWGKHAKYKDVTGVKVYDSPLESIIAAALKLNSRELDCEHACFMFYARKQQAWYCLFKDGQKDYAMDRIREAEDKERTSEEQEELDRLDELAQATPVPEPLRPTVQFETRESAGTDFTEPLLGPHWRASAQSSEPSRLSSVEDRCDESSDEEDDFSDVTFNQEAVRWQDGLAYSEKAKIHLARALMVNPEVLVLQRPFMHYNEATSKCVLGAIEKHVHQRGLALNEKRVHKRRPRTVFFTPSNKEQIPRTENSVIWRIEDPDADRKTRRRNPSTFSQGQESGNVKRIKHEDLQDIDIEM